MIKILEYLFLGIVQGITEPIPVSSSGHLLLIKNILTALIKDFEVDFETLATITNFGSLIAICIYFRKDLIKLITSFFKFIFNKNERTNVEVKKDYKYCWLIVLATIPAGIMGIVVTKLGIFDFLEENLRFLGLMLVVTSFFLYLIKDFNGTKDRENIGFKDAIVVGISQVIALIPGISRSGATIVGGMFRSLKREVAFNFSFILYIPISIATSILGVKDLLELSISSAEWLYYIVATIFAGIFTYIGTIWFSKIVKSGKLIYFSIYCLIVGVLIIALF